MKKIWSTIKNKRGLKRLYLSIIPTIREVARKSGYAVGVHGSLTRDLDLIAVPWIEDCVEPEALAHRIETAICKHPHENEYYYKEITNNVTKKPHGRITFAIYVGVYAYIDLSVIKI